MSAETAHWDRFLLMTIAVVALIAIALVGALAFGFYFIPALLGLFCAWLMYRVIVTAKTRNPIRPPGPTLTEQYADGQPLERAIEHEEEVVEDARKLGSYHHLAEEEHERVDKEAAREAKGHDPADYEGPPPVNPFP